MKLQESNIFSYVCLSVHKGSHVTITHDALNLTIQGLPWHPLYKELLAPALAPTLSRDPPAPGPP